jgi:hypothetical protein
MGKRLASWDLKPVFRPQFQRLSVLQFGLKRQENGKTGAEIVGEERSKEINQVIFKRGGSLSRPATIQLTVPAPPVRSRPSEPQRSSLRTSTFSKF